MTTVHHWSHDNLGVTVRETLSPLSPHNITFSKLVNLIFSFFLFIPGYLTFILSICENFPELNLAPDVNRTSLGGRNLPFGCVLSCASGARQDRGLVSILV
jgi:hypothetical protein